MEQLLLAELDNQAGSWSWSNFSHTVEGGFIGGGLTGMGVGMAAGSGVGAIPGAIVGASVGTVIGAVGYSLFGWE